MRLSDILVGWWYELRGLRISSVGLEEFARVLHPLLLAVLPGYMIESAAGLIGKREGGPLSFEEAYEAWTPEFEEEVIDAHIAHLREKYQPAHNSLQDVKLEPEYRKLHWTLMQTSRAYGETIATYIEYRRLFLSPQYLTRAYYRKQRDGRQWDALAGKHAEVFLDELDQLHARSPEAFRILVPSEDILRGIDSIQAGVITW